MLDKYYKNMQQNTTEILLEALASTFAKIYNNKQLWVENQLI